MAPCQPSGSFASRGLDLGRYYQNSRHWRWIERRNRHKAANITRELIIPEDALILTEPEALTLLPVGQGFLLTDNTRWGEVRNRFDDKPALIEEIPVNAKANAVAFLHTAAYAAAPQGTTFWEYEIRYEGFSRLIPGMDYEPFVETIPETGDHAGCSRSGRSRPFGRPQAFEGVARPHADGDHFRICGGTLPNRKACLEVVMYCTAGALIGRAEREETSIFSRAVGFTNRHFIDDFNGIDDVAVTPIVDQVIQPLDHGVNENLNV